MDAALLAALLAACAPQVHPSTARAIVQVESAVNPFAIGVVGSALERQPVSRTEALATARSLQAQGWDFSVGLAQINARNFARLSLSIESAFDPCRNLSAMEKVLSECFDGARHAAVPASGEQQTLRRALSCYYSGNFVTGFRHGYVRRVEFAALRIR
ncbi:MAG: lytic transglycosylase domain-containing protein [Burkholderiaceae bacterium]|nr:lytic transglycosylase domain-containing protein [Burkholderiaceae bacterium]